MYSNNFDRTGLGRVAKQELGVDVLAILHQFQDDERTDERYRKRSRVKMIEHIDERKFKLGLVMS